MAMQVRWVCTTKMHKASEPRSLEDKLFTAGWIAGLGVIGLIGIYFQYILPYFSTIGCSFYRVTGLYCPGCGGTRALTALLHGNLLQAIRYHVLVPYAAVLYIAFMGSHFLARITGFRYFKGMRFRTWYLYGALVVLILNWIGQNLLKAVWNITL